MTIAPQGSPQGVNRSGERKEPGVREPMETAVWPGPGWIIVVVDAAEGRGVYRLGSDLLGTFVVRESEEATS
jgi:hypothetical protein